MPFLIFLLRFIFIAKLLTGMSFCFHCIAFVLVVHANLRFRCKCIRTVRIWELHSTPHEKWLAEIQDRVTSKTSRPHPRFHTASISSNSQVLRFRIRKLKDKAYALFGFPETGLKIAPNLISAQKWLPQARWHTSSSCILSLSSSWASWLSSNRFSAASFSWVRRLRSWMVTSALGRRFWREFKAHWNFGVSSWPKLREECYDW